MVLLAFSLQDQIEKYGAYVGIVSFFGLAILSLLYFAQAREVKRLRDWAGRAPERAAEVEAMAIEHAEELRRTQQAPAPAAVPAQTAAAQAAPAAANGAVKLAPAEVAALAFARAAGVHTPHPPRPHPAPVAAAVPATEVAAAGAATATGDVAAPQDLAPASNGHGTGTVPPPVAPAEGAEPAVPGPATPAARRAEAPAAAAPADDPPRRPEPAAPLRQTPPPRRPAPRRPVSARPARRESSARVVALTAVVAVLVLGAAAFAVTQLFGGSDNSPQPPKVAQSTPAPSATATASAQATPALTKATMRVAVYNGTVQSGLAGGVRDQLVNLGYNPDNVGADTYTPNQQRQASVVMYERGDRPAAATVARNLDISDVRLVDSATQNLIDQSGKKWDVIVIVGADKSQ